MAIGKFFFDSLSTPCGFFLMALYLVFQIHFCLFFTVLFGPIFQILLYSLALSSGRSDTSVLSWVVFGAVVLFFVLVHMMYVNSMVSRNIRLFLVIS
jgi:hypothetical protein